MKNNDEFRSLFQIRLVDLRKRSMLSQNEFADEIGISRSAVRDWEAGDKMPCAMMLIKIADYFRVTVDYLVGRDSLRSLIVEDLSEEASTSLGEFLRNVSRMKTDTYNGVSQR